MITRLPRCTALMLVTSIAVYRSSTLSSLLVFDRLAIEQGEYWRLLTGHLVHFSSTHLVANLVALGLVGCVIEQLQRKGAAGLPVAMALCISTVLYLFEPHMLFYGGLSGIAYGLAAYLALYGFGEGRYRAVSALALGAMLWLVARDFLSVEAGTLVPRQESFEPMPMSHLAGVATALAWMPLKVVWSRVTARRAGFHKPRSAFHGT